VTLTALTESPENDPEAEGLQRYAGEIPLEGRFADSIPLSTPGADVDSTYDLRLGDATGRRPAGLPEAVVQDVGGEFLLSETVLDGGMFTGWAFHTADGRDRPQPVLGGLEEQGRQTKAWHPPSRIRAGAAVLSS
jgi:hypothetical protein